MLCLHPLYSSPKMSLVGHKSKHAYILPRRFQMLYKCFIYFYKFFDTIGNEHSYLNVKLYLSLNTIPTNVFNSRYKSFPYKSLMLDTTHLSMHGFIMCMIFIRHDLVQSNPIDKPTYGTSSPIMDLICK